MMRIEKEQQIQEDYINNQFHKRNQKLMASLRNLREEKETHLAVAGTTKNEEEKLTEKTI